MTYGKGVPERSSLIRVIIRSSRHGTGIIGLSCAVNLALVSTAFAYIDPGTGTMILQVAGALFASALFYLRSIRIWIAEKLGFRRVADPALESADSETMPVDHSDRD